MSQPISAAEQPPTDHWQQLCDALARQWPPARWLQLGVVVGCSGGADSVALLRGLQQLRSANQPSATGFLVAAHVNHGLRGDASQDDAQFVQQLAGALDVRVETTKLHRDDDDEATLREQRLQFLIDVAYRHGARYVALAHSADDNAETILHQLMRGTGPVGLCGIAPFRDLHRDLVLAHPLLTVQRETIRGALRQIGQPWREDASNDSLRYQRNWIRHRVLPLLRERYPHATDAINRAAAAQRHWQHAIGRQVQAWLAKHVTSESPLRLHRPTDAPQAVVVMALQQLWDQNGWPRGEMSQVHWQRLCDTLQSTTPQTYHLPAAVEVTASENVVQIRY